MAIEFEIVGTVPPNGSCGKYAEIAEALLSLPKGQCVKISRNTFGVGTAEGALRMKRRCGRSCRQKAVGEFIYLWMEAPLENADHA